MSPSDTVTDRLTVENTLRHTDTGTPSYQHLLFHIDEYKEVRDEVHQEYTLMANRVNWLLASQTFLFTALAIATPKETQALSDLSANAFYKIAPVIGICSCWLISSAIVANILRIWDWKRIQRELLGKIEFITPKLPRDGLPGFGLLPPVGLPFLFFTLWGYILFSKINLFFESRVVFALVFAATGILSLWSSAFFFYCLDEETVNRVFKRPIEMVKKSRRWMFWLTMLVFLTLIFGALFLPLR